MSIRLRLFGDLADSPVYREITDEEIESIITPDSKGDDYGIGSDIPLSISPHTALKPRITIDARRSLFPSKRPVGNNQSDDSPYTKRVRRIEADLTALSTQNVIQAVERLESGDLVADGSRDYILPTTTGRHVDLQSITPKTMADVLGGTYKDYLGDVTIIDCRYPYEFEGGHIQGAVNMYMKDEIHALLRSPVTSEKPHVLIFHCEFSSERAPKMYRFLRSQDRELNKNQYPRLNFPEVYLLDGGYKEFFKAHKESCEPINYKPMLHADHAAELRHFRVKSKSWTAGDNEKIRHQRSRFSRHISF